MPGFRPPSRSGSHRIAALALYRALLTQCRALPFAPQHRDELRNAVRNRFRHARLSQSLQRLRISFEAGYEALDHLDAAVAGDETSRSYISDLLNRMPERLKVPPVVKHTPQKKEAACKPESHAEKKPSIFDRPLPLSQLSGRRHIPVLFNANGIPVLRIKKPQPENLSRYIRQRIQRRQRQLDGSRRLSEEAILARHEDKWDELISDTSRMNIVRAMVSPGPREPEWTSAVDSAIRDLQIRVEAEKRKNQAMAEKMQAVVDREKASLAEERAARKGKQKGHQAGKGVTIP